MRNILFIVFVILSASEESIAQDTTFNVKYFNTLPSLSIRSLEARSDSCAWFSANHGVWGYTEDAGKTWHIDSIKVDSVYPEFRSMAVLNDSTVLLLSIASPAYLFKTTNKGKTWKLVYKNSDKNIFFDSMKFWDEKNGIAIGDPIDGCFQIIKTTDVGETWKQVDCAGIPKALEGESLFASSNSCLDICIMNVWFVTGGKYARVFHSQDSGTHYTVANTPIVQGNKMTGIFSVSVTSFEKGIIVGGDYTFPDSSKSSVAITRDGGKTWTLQQSKKIIFGSCVKFFRNRFIITGSTGTFLGYLNTKKIKEIKDRNTSLLFYTVCFSPNGRFAWLGGNKGRIAFINFAQ